MTPAEQWPLRSAVMRMTLLPLPGVHGTKGIQGAPLDQLAQNRAHLDDKASYGAHYQAAAQARQLRRRALSQATCVGPSSLLHDGQLARSATAARLMLVAVQSGGACGIGGRHARAATGMGGRLPVEEEVSSNLSRTGAS